MTEEEKSPSTTEEGKKVEVDQWFAMRATYRCEMAMKEELESKGFVAFVPTVLADRVIKGRKKRVWVPAVASLIFVFGKKNDIQEFKKRHERLQYLCKFGPNNTRTPIIVPEYQMKAFIKIYESGNYEITDNPDIINSIKPGQRVRVIEGPFMDLTGTFQKMKGKRNKQFIIKLDQIACITTTEINPNMIEVTED